MANIKISELTALTLTDAADLVPVTDTSASQTKRTTVGKIVGIINGDVDVADDGTATISELPVSKLQDGDARQLLQTAANGDDVEWTSNVDVPGTLDVTGAATLDSTLGVTGQSTLASAAVSDLTSGRVVLAGTSGELEDNAGLTFNGTQLDVDGNVVITGDLTVEGASTILETETVKVEDKNIELGVVASPTDVTADGGGITLKGTTDKTINWVNTTDSWTISEHVDLASGKSYRINGTEVLSATALGSAVQISSANIPSGTIVDDDVNASAAIAGTKISPDFGAQNVTTTGTSTAASFIPTSSSVPTNGVYLPSANNVAISTNGAPRINIEANGDINIDSGGVFYDATSNRLAVGTITPTAALSIGDTSTAASNQIRVHGPASGTAGGSSINVVNGTNTVFAAGNASNVIGGSYSSDAMVFWGNANLRFYGNSSELARIDSFGRLLVGTPASPAYQLQLETDSAGKPSTNTWTIVSDERIKEEIELADLDLCYEAVKNIPLKRFKWKDEVYTEDQAYDRRKLGWIAQDVEAVFPKAVRQHEFKYNQVFEEIIIPAVPAELDDDGNIIIEEQPERIEKGELISEEVIEDCRDLNSDQIYAAMYGTIQKLISKVELLEAEMQALKAA